MAELHAPVATRHPLWTPPATLPAPALLGLGQRGPLVAGHRDRLCAAVAVELQRRRARRALATVAHAARARVRAACWAGLAARVGAGATALEHHLLGCTRTGAICSSSCMCDSGGITKQGAQLLINGGPRGCGVEWGVAWLVAVVVSTCQQAATSLLASKRGCAMARLCL